MNTPLTEQVYPIQNRWILKQTIILSGSLTIFLFWAFFEINSEELKNGGGIILILACLILVFFIIIIYTLSLLQFHYTIDDNFLIVRHGILEKRQRNTPFGTIQNIIAGQDIFDKLLGISTLTIENATSAGGVKIQTKKGAGIAGSLLAPGSYRNMIVIPGLKKNDAETLKQIILQK